MNNNIKIAKKEIIKSIINELFEKNIIDFYQCNNIIKKIDEDISKINIKEDISNMIINITI